MRCRHFLGKAKRRSEGNTEMRIIDNPVDLCTGCSGCYSVCPKKAIEMVSDDEGFLYPTINERTCVECGLCRRTCPVNAPEELKCDPAEHKAFAYICGDDAVRGSCSSGGAFASMAAIVLSKGGIVYGVEYGPDFIVRHARYTTLEGAKACRTSKYVQSFKGNAFSSVLEDLRGGKTVLFSGVPCEIAGLKSFIRGKSGASSGYLYLCDLLCHGAASPLLFSEHVRFLESRHGELASYNFRYKRAGANWHLHESLAATRTGEYTGRDVTAFQDCFDATYANRPSCGQCKFKSMGRVGDVTLADYWGVEKWHPELDDDKGVSLLLANTAAGRDLAHRLGEHGRLAPLAEGEFTQQTLVGPMGLARKRPKFWDCYRRRGYVATIKLFTDFGFLHRVLHKHKDSVRGILRR